MRYRHAGESPGRSARRARRSIFPDRGVCASRGWRAVGAGHATTSSAARLGFGAAQIVELNVFKLLTLPSF